MIGCVVNHVLSPMEDTPARFGDRSPVDRGLPHGKHGHKDAQKRKEEEGEGLFTAPQQGFFKKELLYRRQGDSHKGNKQQLVRSISSLQHMPAKIVTSLIHCNMGVGFGGDLIIVDKIIYSHYFGNVNHKLIPERSNNT